MKKANSPEPNVARSNKTTSTPIESEGAPTASLDDLFKKVCELCYGTLPEERALEIADRFTAVWPKLVDDWLGSEKSKDPQLYLEDYFVHVFDSLAGALHEGVFCHRPRLAGEFAKFLSLITNTVSAYAASQSPNPRRILIRIQAHADMWARKAQLRPTASAMTAPSSGQVVSNSRPKRETAEEKSRRRRSIVGPLLVEHGLNTNSWSVQAKLPSPRSAYAYLNGERSLRADTRQKLAEALGKQPEDLPE